MTEFLNILNKLAPYIIGILGFIWGIIQRQQKATDQKADKAQEDAKCAKKIAVEAKGIAGANRIHINGVKEDLGEVKEDVKEIKGDIKTILRNGNNGDKT